MKPFNGFDKAKDAVKFEGLPKGAYELVIKGATPYKFIDKRPVDISRSPEDTPDFLDIYVDIASGDFKDYFSKQYANNQSEDKKWRGVLKLYWPKDDGTDKDQWSKNAFARATNAIEDSNEGYFWDWDEKKLKGKQVGGLFNFREYWKGDGTVGKALNLAAFCPIEKIRDGSAKVPEDKELKDKSKYVSQDTINQGFINVPDNADDEGLPFN